MASPLKDVNNNIPECECTNLTENDIPGSSLTNVPEKCKVSDLRIWLRCRGQNVKAKETKAELCLRVKKCVESGGPFTFCDPYPGKPHIQKKKHLCSVCNIDKTLVIKATSAENGKDIVWSKDASCLPRGFTYLSLLEYSKSSGKNIKEPVEKPMNRGYSFFFDGYIHDILTSKNSSKINVKCKCYKSMKKHEAPHGVQISTCLDGKVLSGTCSCVAGASGFCNHVFALLYQIDHSVKINQKVFGAKKTCTELPALWSKSRTEGIKSEPVMSGNAIKPRYGSVSSGIKSTLYDARSGDAKANVSISDAIKSLKDINPLIGICQTGSTCEVPSFKTSMGFNVPVGSVLSYQLSLTEGDFSVVENTKITPDLVVENRDNVPPFPWKQGQFPNIVEDNIIKDLGLSITSEEAIELEKETKEQSLTNAWFEARKHRLTASRFGGIVKRKKNKETYVKDLLTEKNLSHISAIKYGHDNEQKAVDHYLKYKTNNKRKTSVQMWCCCQSPFSMASSVTRQNCFK